jgi:SAM-dependent methyltransferase
MRAPNRFERHELKPESQLMTYSPLKHVFRSAWLWRLTGATYRSAVIATRGHYLPLEGYLSESQQMTLRLHPFLRTESKVLEFGCGLGGNLFAISQRIGRGTGLDVNGGYIRQASRLATTLRINNIRFLQYDGMQFPEIGRFDVVFSFAVFERIPKSKVATYVSWLVSRLVEGGRIIFYFLDSTAKETGFTDRLGPDAYSFWTAEEASALIQRNGCTVETVEGWNHWLPSERCIAHICVAVKHS